MKDQVAEGADHVRAWKVPVARGEAPRRMAEIVGESARSAAHVVVLRSDMIFGLDHIKAAYSHAKHAIDEGRGASDSLPMEIILYASGERQLATAIKKMSVDDGTTEMVIASVGQGSFEPGQGWVPLVEGMLKTDLERLRRYGISDREIQTIARGREPELVLEKVAAVDILKK